MPEYGILNTLATPEAGMGEVGRERGVGRRGVGRRNSKSNKT
jgi:hypothetical protein